MKQATIVLALTGGLAWPAAALSADETATPQEIIAKVREAAAYLADKGEAGLATFDTVESPFVWKDSYVFVYDCDANVIAAHPVTSKGMKISALEDVNGVPFGDNLCAATETAGGSWTEYAWPKPVKEEGAEQLAYSDEPSRKISYMLDVDGQPYQVGAGVFDDTLTIDELNALLSQ